MDRKILELLYRSFDDKLNSEEQEVLNNALKDSPELQQEKERITLMRRTVSGSAEESFKPFFAERVMQRIKTQTSVKKETTEDFFNSLLWSFRRVAIAGVAAALILLAINFIEADSISVDSALSMPQLTLEDAWSLDDVIEEELP